MPKSHRSRSYRSASRKEQSLIFFLGYQLDELFTEEMLEDLCDVARHRIIGEFHHATERNPRYKTGSDRRPYQRTDNYIWGLSNKPSELARYVNEHMHHPFVSPSQLPPGLTELRPRLVEMIVQRAQYDILVMVVQLMRNREIWYDEGVGIWQACQSSLDDYHSLRKLLRSIGLDPNKHTARSSHRVKADMRPFHGRVRSQSKRREIPAGTSVGLA